MQIQSATVRVRGRRAQRREPLTAATRLRTIVTQSSSDSFAFPLPLPSGVAATPVHLCLSPTRALASSLPSARRYSLPFAASPSSSSRFLVRRSKMGRKTPPTFSIPVVVVGRAELSARKAAASDS